MSQAKLLLIGGLLASAGRFREYLLLNALAATEQLLRQRCAVWLAIGAHLFGYLQPVPSGQDGLSAQPAQDEKRRASLRSNDADVGCAFFW